VARGRDRLPQCLEVGGGVDQEGGPPRPSGVVARL
jgi:hypothetical protein